MVVFDSMGLVRRGMIDRSVICRLDVLVRLSDTLVFDISDVAGVPINVIGHNLTAAVGENNRVRSLGIVTIAGLVPFY